MTFIVSRSQKPKLKLNSRTIRALGLLKVLQNYQKKSKLYEKLLKNRFLDTIKKRSKKKFYSEKLQKFKGDARKTWSVMEEMLGPP